MCIKAPQFLNRKVYFKEGILIMDSRLENNPIGKRVVLYSGGLDSYLISRLWENDVKLFVDIHSLGNKGELKKLGDDVVIEYLTDIGKFELPESEYLLPLRNLYFVMLAARHGTTICLGATKSSKNIDKNYEFCDLASKILSYLSPQLYGFYHEIKVVIPFKEYSKKEILQMYLDNGGTLEDAFNSTSSCYNPNADGSACRECSSCKKRIEAFKELGYEV